MIHPSGFVRVALAAALLSVAAAPVAAQAYNYPQFQPPRAATAREFNVGLSGAGHYGTSLVGQWREPMGTASHLSFDLGFASPDNASAFFFGGQFARQLARETASMPLDLLLTIGAGFASINPNGNGDNGSLVRVPVGVVLGHRFPIQGSAGMAITPYLHPRVAFQRVSAGGASDSQMAVDFELGGDFVFTPALALRAAARLGGGDYLNDDAFGISLAWTPGR